MKVPPAETSSGQAQVSLSPPQQAKSAASVLPLQLLSAPSSQTSAAAGLTAALPSSQSGPPQEAGGQLSPSPSMSVLTQALAPPSQVSAVQASASSQISGTVVQPPEAGVQTSRPLHTSPSEQRASSGVWAHASASSSHASRVQAMPSSAEQSGAAPARHPRVRSQVSVPLQ